MMLQSMYALTAREQSIMDTGIRHHVVQVSAMLVSHASMDAPRLTDVMYGEPFYAEPRAARNTDEWIYGYAPVSGCTGFIHVSALESDVVTPTHRVVKRTALVQADHVHKSPVLMQLGMNSLVQVVGESRKFFCLSSGGWIPKTHVEPIDMPSTDFVSVAERLIGCPYRSGRRDPQQGINCSAVVHHALLARGHRLTHGVVQLAQELARRPETAARVELLSGLMRGDILFWHRHVGIMTDHEQLLHATNTAMETCIQPLREVSQGIDRITSMWRLVK